MKQNVRLRRCCENKINSQISISLPAYMMRPAYPFVYFPMYFSFYC